MIKAFPLVVHIQIKHGWDYAFGSLAIAIGMSNLLFYVGAPLYRLTRLREVLGVAFRKQKASFRSSGMIGLYEVPGKQSAIKGNGRSPTPIISNGQSGKVDGPNPGPWRPWTVTDVEEVKFLRLVLTKYLTLSVQLAYTLHTTMVCLLPVTCMPVFPGMASSSITGEDVIRHGYKASFLIRMPDRSAYWRLIQYCQIRYHKVFAEVRLLEFLYEEAPDAMKSIGSAYSSLAGEGAWAAFQRRWSTP